MKPLMTHPLPIERLRAFAESVERCVVIEEGDPVMAEALRAEGVVVDSKPAMYRFGELTVNRVRRILDGDTSEEPAPPKGRPPQLCPGCPHRTVFEVLSKLECIVSGDIGCYSLGVLPPFEAMDSLVCMGASIGVGLGLRHVLPGDEARKVVSVIGDSTFVHSGMTGIAEMIYNPPPGGHLVMILDNGTTAMTGLQEHPGTGRRLNHEPTGRVVFEELCPAMGAETVVFEDPNRDVEGFEKAVREALENDKPTVMVVRRPCILAAKKQKKMAQAECKATENEES